MSDYQKFYIDQKIMVKDFLGQHISNKALKKVKYEGGIQVNGKNCTVRHLLLPGDILELFYPEEQASEQMNVWYFPLKVIYEDEYLLVINKPQGMPSIPTRHYSNYTLANALLGYYQMHGINSKVHLVSRLDKDTSGLILVAKSQRMHRLLNDAFERKYLLLVEGILDGEGTVDVPISRNEDSLKRFVKDGGKRAITDYRSIKVLADSTLVECTLHTGRTHQIRVHMAYLGHPLVGDLLYGKAHPDFYGQALHSYYLEFVHPETNEKMIFKDYPFFASI